MEPGDACNTQGAQLSCCEQHRLALVPGPAVAPPYELSDAAVMATGTADLLGDHHATNGAFLAALMFEEHAALHLAEAAHAAEKARSHRIDGASTLAGWASHHGRADRRDVRRHVRRGAAIERLPLLRAAWSSHAISSGHVDVIARLIDDADPVRSALLDRDEELLVGVATQLDVADFAQAMRHWEALADPDGHEADWIENHDRRRVTFARDLMGNLLIQGQLDAAEGDAVMAALGAVESELFEADWAEARERLGREPLVSELDRTNAQRRADALVLSTCGSSDDDHLRPAVAIDYVVDHQTFEETLDQLERGAIGVCQSHEMGWVPTLPDDSLASFAESGVTVEDLLPDTRAAFDPMRRSETLSGFPMPPTVILADALRARVRRVVFQGPSVVVDAGRSRRLFSGPQRNLVRLQQRQCASPYCDRPVWECEIDHRLPWDAGGGTDLANAQALCPQHHRQKSESERRRRDPQLAIRADGNLELT